MLSHVSDSISYTFLGPAAEIMDDDENEDENENEADAVGTGDSPVELPEEAVSSTKTTHDGPPQTQPS